MFRYLPSRVSEELKAETKKENALVEMFEKVKRTAERKPYRPSYGTKGDAVEFPTNYFPVNLPHNLVMYRYRITVDPESQHGQQLLEPKNKKLKRIIKIWLNLLQSSLRELPVATDFKSTVICTERIPKGWWVTRVNYLHEDDQALGAVPQRYMLQIEETPPPLEISVLKDFLASTDLIAPFEDRELMLQALNIIFGHHSKSSPTITVIGSNRAYPNESTEKWPLTGGLEAIRGYFLSVRLASFRSIVNVCQSRGFLRQSRETPRGHKVAGLD